MRKVFGVIVALLMAASSCSKMQELTNGSNAANVAGTWQGTVAFTGCTPAAVCAAAGFSGGSAIGIMTLTQSGNNVNGSYTYKGAGISASVSGVVNGNNVTVDGSASNPFGTVTVHLTGTADQNSMPSNLTHQIHLADGRSGTVTGSGDFSKQ